MGSSKKHKKESKKKKHKSRSRSPLTPGAERPRKHHKKHRKRERERSPDVEEVPVDSHLQVSENGEDSSGNDEQYQRDRGTHEEVRAEKEIDQRKDYDEGKSYREEARSHKEERSHRQDTRTHREDDGSYREERRSQKDDGRSQKEDGRSQKDDGRSQKDDGRSQKDDGRSQKEDGRSQKEDDRSQRESPRQEIRVQKEKDPSPAAASSSYTESLSIEETNRLRAKLGLKPLQVQEKTADDGKITDDLGEFYHKPAANISDQKKTEKLKEKLKERKERRDIEKRLKTSTLVDDSDDEDASAWVNKSRKLQKEKEDAAKRAAALDEMDLEFGVGALVAAEEQEARARSYTAAHLHGLRVAHHTDDLGEEREVVLTLADKNVLDEDKEDVLINVNIADDERYRKAVKDRIAAAAGYRAYEDAEDVEAAALGHARPVLAKYDEEIERAGAGAATGAGATAGGDKGFVIGDEDALEARRFRQMMIKERLAGAGQKRLESLAFTNVRIASDYLSEKEMEAKFKKPKKKGKMRKKPKSEPIDVDEYDPSTAPLDTDDTEVKLGTLVDVKVDEEEELEPDSELQVALARARRLQQARDIASKIPKVEDIARRVKEEAASEMEAESAPAPGGAAMVLDATAEFCRTLGDIPTYGQAGNRDTHLDIMDIEADIVEPERADGEEGGGAGAWSRVDTQADKPADITSSDACGLEAEPALGGGVGGALRVALSKGYLERAAPQPPARLHTHAHLLEARHYSIEDKAYQDDDKYARRGGGGDRYAGPLQDFREKSNFKPNIKLEYADDEGRPLCPKEAFRYLSHKFHGKGPGKNKQEKRLKKQLQEGLMKKMSSTDTPLNTLAMLQDKQKETHSPFIVLSGAKTKTAK